MKERKIFTRGIINEIILIRREKKTRIVKNKWDTSYTRGAAKNIHDNVNILMRSKCSDAQI